MTTASPSDDGLLVARVLDGEDGAFAVIMRAHRTAIYRVALGFTVDADAALDLTQEIFVAAYRNLAKFDQSRALRPWLSAIALNRCRDWRRKVRVRRWFRSDVDPQAAIDAAVDDAPGQDRVVAGQVALNALLRQIATLPKRLQEVLILRTIERLTQAETAETLGITVKAVETRLARAIRAARQIRGMMPVAA